MRELLFSLAFFLLGPSPDQRDAADYVYRRVIGWDQVRIGELRITMSSASGRPVSIYYGAVNYEYRLWLQNGRWFLINLARPWNGEEVPILRGKPDGCER